eukprot:COSAG01_NODE_3049_length_6666_cov_2.071418_6_plen_66_part_00
MDSLVAMGFDPANCEAALHQSNQDVESALNLLLGGFVATSIPPPEAAAAATAAAATGPDTGGGAT